MSQVSLIQDPSALEAAVRKAVYARLSKTVSCPVFDAVPEGTPMPYVEIGESTAAPWDTKSHFGIDTTLMIHTWSSRDTSKEILQFGSEISRALTGQDIDLGGVGSIGGIRCEFHETLKDIDGSTRHLVQRFRFLVQGR